MSEKGDKKVGERIKELRKKTNISVDHISRIIGINYHTWYRWERGQQISPKSIRSITYAFIELGVICTPEWLETGEGEPPSALKEETLSNVESLTETMKIYREAEVFRSNYPEAMVIMNTSSGFTPQFFPGDFIGGLVIPTKDIPLYTGTYCLVELKQGRACLRKFQYLKDRYIFHVTNPSYHNISPYIIDKPPARFATVVYHRRISVPDWDTQEGDEGSYP